MEKLLKILVGLLLFMVCSVNSADSNTAVDLRTLGRMMCRKRKVFYTEGYRDFCEVARRELCSRYSTRSHSRCVQIKSHRFRYQMMRTVRDVCWYSGRDYTTKRVRESLGPYCFMYA